MKTNLTNWLCGLCAILLIAVLIFQFKQQGRLDALQRQQETLSSAVGQQQQQQRDLVAGLANQVTNLSVSLEARLAQSEKQQKAENSERVTNFREMRQQLDDLVSSGALFPNKSKPAGEAVVLAKAAEKTGDINLAKIYYLSAINHAPSEFSMLNDYAGLVFRDSSATTADFARLKSVLQISLYQIPPASVTNALALLSEAMRREEQLLAAQTPKPVPVNWQARFEQLTKSNALENAWADLKQISRRWDGLSEIAESLREEQPDSDLTKQVEGELELTQRVLAAARFAKALDTMMAALHSSSEQPEKAVSLLQTAEATLGQLWGIDSAGWPAALRSKIDQYPKEIQGRVEAVAKVKSRPFTRGVTDALKNAQQLTNLLDRLPGIRDPINRLRAVKAEFEEIRIILDTNTPAVRNMPIPLSTAGAYQRVCLHYLAALQHAQTNYSGISSVTEREVAEHDIESIRSLLVVAKQKQFDAYQKWAVDLCAVSFRNWSAQLFTSNTGILRNLFGASQLDQIDQSLLTSETGHLFKDVLGKLTTKMDGNGQFQTQKEIAERKKKKLEEF